VSVVSVYAAYRVLESDGVHGLGLLLSLVVLEAQPVSLLEDEQFARVTLGVVEPALLAPGLWDDLHVFGGGDTRLSALGCGITGAGVLLDSAVETGASVNAPRGIGSASRPLSLLVLPSSCR